MAQFFTRLRLKWALNHLAIYNDKGIDWSRHSLAQIEQTRLKSVRKIQQLVEQLSPESVPPVILIAINSGDLATDLTGKYVDAFVQHKNLASAP